MASKRKPTEWHPEDIKCAVRKTGITLTRLALMHGLPKSACRVALIMPYEAAERVIAAYLGKPPHELWPLRYHGDGSRRRHLWSSGNKNSRSAGVSERQKGKAA